METEDEQVEKLKAWLKQNSLSILLGIVIGVGGLSGYRYWEFVQKTEAEQASSYFSALMTALADKDGDAVELNGNQLIENFATTDYAQMARFGLAKHYLEKGDLEQAQAQLQQVVDSATEHPQIYIARTRLAALQLQSENLDAAMSTLSIEFPQQFAGRVYELRGDILVQQGKSIEAVAAYRQAQQATPPPANADFLQQKMDQLGSQS